MSTSDEGYDYLAGQRSPTNRILDFLKIVMIFGLMYLGYQVLITNFSEYLELMNIPILIGTSLLLIPFWSFVFEKMQLMVESYSIDFTNVPILGKFKPHREEIQSQFITHDGYPLNIIYKGKPITRTVLQMVAGLELAEIYNRVDELIIENAMYQNYQTRIIQAITKESIDLADPAKLKNILEAMEVNQDDKILLETDKDIPSVPKSAVNES